MRSLFGRIPSANLDSSPHARGASIKRWLARYEPLLMLAWGAVFLFLGCLGFKTYNECYGPLMPLAHNLYQALQLFMLNSINIECEDCVRLPLQLARFFAPTLTFYAAIRALLFIFSKQIFALRLSRSRNHIVICGLGRRGFIFAKEFLKGAGRVVVIEENPVNKYMNQCRERGALVLEGNATDPEILGRARVDRAKCLVAVCGADSTNADIATQTAKLSGRKTGAPTCFIHIFDPNLCHLLVEQALSEASGLPRLEFFNIYNLGAQSIVADHPGFGKIDDPHGRPPHLLVIGVGRMGQSLIYHAAHAWWTKHRGVGQKMKVTAIDRDAINKAESLRLRFPQLSKSCEILPLKMDIESPEFHKASFLFDAAGACVITGIVISFDDDSKSLSAALTMMQHMRDCPAPLIVRMAEEVGLASLIERAKAGSSSFAGMETFALCNKACTKRLLGTGVHEPIAQSIHEMYLRQGAARGETVITNPSMVPWSKLPEYLKESNRLQADDIATKLKTIGCAIVPLTDWEADRFAFSQGEIEKMAQMEHERWVQEKVSLGYTYGPVKDAEKKTNPNIVPWHQLTDPMKEIDRDSVRTIPMILAGVELQVHRKR
jgi:voltage-gated potassium channel Kch